MKLPYIILCAVIVAAVMSLRSAVVDALMPADNASPRRVELSQAIELVRQGAAEKATITGDHVEIVDRSGSRVVTRKEPGASFLQTLQGHGLTTEQISAVQTEVRPEAASGEVVLLIGVVLAGLIGLLFFLAFRSRSGWALGRVDPFGFRRSTAREHGAGQSRLTFDDVAGAEDAKQELREVVEFLRAPARFATMGARVPRGLLLAGAPGTGKTLLARAVAGEAGVPFFSCSASEFVEMFVGVGAARIRDLFQRARGSAPCIVFIDEIDAIGRRRNAGAGNEEREQALNQILVEMDGFDKCSNVVVMAATNRPDVLDPALLRPGRFDRRILVDSPDLRDRVAILRVHARGKPLAPGIELEKVARQTTGFSGADLENVMNEAALLAARRGAESIGAAEVEEAVDRVLIGLAQKSRVIGEREKRITAYHEAGHALVARRLPNLGPVQRISIIPRGVSGGHTRLQPEDRRLWSRSQLYEAIILAMGGMAAEELMFGEMTTASAGDLAEATDTARKMVCLFGMGRELGPISLGGAGDVPMAQGLSERTAAEADAETRNLLKEGRERALQMLRAERPCLELLGERLMERETLQGEELSALLSDPVDPRLPVPGGEALADGLRAAVS